MSKVNGVPIAVLTTAALTLALILALSCGDDPAAPTRDNPLDPGNPETSGDPFGLVVEVRADGVHLSWSIPEGPEIAQLQVLRRVDRAGGYGTRADLGPAATTWKDGTIANGRTYEYKVIAVDREGRTSSESSVREVRVDTDPVWTLNNGQRYTTNRTVPLTLLATTAVSMRVFAGTDTSSVPWVPVTAAPSVTLSEDQGHYQVSAQVRYDDGSESPVWTGTVALDTEPPVIAISQTSLDANTRTVTMSADGTMDHSGICPADSLTYRWHWGDDTTDGPSTDRTGVRAYTKPGPWTITLTVTDLAGHEADTTWTLPLTNQPPPAPALSSPAADAVDVSRTASLDWQASVDPEGDAVTYNVYHGLMGNMAQIAGGISATTLLIDGMNLDAIYQWRVVAVDAWGDSAQSEVWSFTTVGSWHQIVIIPIMDTYVDSASPYRNFGDDVDLMLGKGLSSGLGLFRGYLMFDVSSLAGGTVESAMVRLLQYRGSGAGGLPCDAHRVLGPWLQNSLTWNNKPTHHSEVISSQDVGGHHTGWIEWDVTRLVQWWVDGTVINYGLVLKHYLEIEAGASRFGYFRSTESGVDTPELVVHLSGQVPVEVDRQ